MWPRGIPGPSDQRTPVASMRTRTTANIHASSAISTVDAPKAKARPVSPSRMANTVGTAVTAAAIPRISTSTQDACPRPNHAARVDSVTATGAAAGTVSSGSTVGRMNTATNSPMMPHATKAAMKLGTGSEKPRAS